jgi:hypothetical protein
MIQIIQGFLIISIIILPSGKRTVYIIVQKQSLSFNMIKL